LPFRLAGIPFLFALITGSLAVASPVQKAAELVGAATMPLAEVQVGMRGVGYTVVRGVEPATFEAEILGVLPDVFPKQPLIVARLTGLGLERSGVVAGMSGSPVVIDGRIIGAVAYRLVNFGHEAIAGIVPIANMLALEGSRPAEVAARPGAVEGLLTSVAARMTGGTAEAAPEPLAVAPGIDRISTPVSLSGWRPEVVDSIAPLFASLGWTATAGGGAATGSVQPNLVPGGAVAVQLVRGDINVTASGTITYVDGDGLVAFGHPFMQGGAVDFPLVAAEVITVLSASQASSKLTVSGQATLGAVRQDRLPAIFGVIGSSPAMIPVASRIAATGVETSLDFEIVADPMLTPLYLFLGLVNGVQSLDAVYGDGAIEVRGAIRLAGGDREVRFGDLFSSQNQAILGMSSTLAGIFGALYNNSFEPIAVDGVDLRIALRPDRRNARIERVWADRLEARPGDEVLVSVALEPYRAPVRIERVAVRLPDDLQPGPLSLLVTSAAGLVDEEARLRQGTAPTDLDSLVVRLNDAPRADHVHILGYRPQGGVVLEGRQLPGLPGSMLEVLGADRGVGGVVPLAQEIVLRQSVATDLVLEGAHRLQLEVKRR